MSEQTQRIVANVTPEQQRAWYAALEEDESGDSANEILCGLIAAYCKKRGVKWPKHEDSRGGARVGAGRKRKVNEDA